MTKNKTTISPSPWIWWSETGNRPKLYDLDHIKDAKGNHIFDLYDNGEMTPDKKLIAAAPLLLDACKFVLNDSFRSRLSKESEYVLESAIREATYVPKPEVDREEYGYA